MIGQKIADVKSSNWIPNVTENTNFSPMYLQYCTFKDKNSVYSWSIKV